MLMRMDPEMEDAFDSLCLALAGLALVRVNLQVLGNALRAPDVMVDERFANDLALTDDAVARVDIQITEAVEALALSAIKRSEVRQ